MIAIIIREKVCMYSAHMKPFKKYFQSEVECLDTEFVDTEDQLYHSGAALWPGNPLMSRTMLCFVKFPTLP
jgi:hypothetical protein